MTQGQSDIFASILEAAEALREKPMLEERVKAAEAAQRAAEDNVFALLGRLENHKDIISRSADRIAELEASYDAATFREGEVRGKLEVLRETFRSLMGTIGDALELTKDPEPIPEPVSVIEDASVPLGGSTPNSDPVSDGSAPSALVPAQPPLADAAGPETNAAFQPVTPSSPEAESGTGTGAEIGWLQPQLTGYTGSDAGHTGIPEAHSDGPFASSEADRFSGADSSSAGCSAQSPGDASSVSQRDRFLGWPHWRKPTDATWSEFIAGGGDRPYWVSDELLAVY